MYRQAQEYFYEGLMNKLLIAVFFTWFAPAAFATCTTPKHLICSITVGSENELNAFKTASGATANLSGDGCIKFHEFVRPSDPWNPTTRTYAWHREMMEVGVSTWPGKTCDLLIVSGHHDWANTAGDAPSGYHLKRNQFVYSNQFYDHEKSYPALAAGAIRHSPPASTSVAPGPRLLLPQLARAAPICNDRFDVANYNGTVNYHPTWTPQSGNVLLSDLLSVFLFACNFSAGADEKAGKINTGEVAVRLPTASATDDKELYLKAYTFQTRTQIIFGSALKLYTFPKTAPLGGANERDVVHFLEVNLKHEKYRDRDEFLTLYLDDLRALKTSGASISQYSITAAGLVNPSLNPLMSACKAKTAPSCVCIRTADRSRCVQECGLDADDRTIVKDAYCAGMTKFYDFWKVRSSRDTDAIIRRNRLVKPMNYSEAGAFVNGNARRADEAHVTPYDIEWFY